ncbi:hypothetical protein NDU88_008309 [Pleurodeles waltl]|uniref:Uncharacterized protein n=1 Tax=Pleurodeles waltl TaxID=8319 RepID=A0AAV7N4K3_PLEWA|nr:hypothetical protein NDU88_008309 [Pleurodeles waltl]
MQTQAGDVAKEKAETRPPAIGRRFLERPSGNSNDVKESSTTYKRRNIAVPESRGHEITAVELALCTKVAIS